MNNPPVLGPEWQPVPDYSDQPGIMQQRVALLASSPLGNVRALRRWLMPAGHTGDVPTIVIVGGHHGDEPAGFTAASWLTHATSIAGPVDLIIAPQANPAACLAASRYAPDWTGGALEDLNRWYDPTRPPTARPAPHAPDREHAAQLLASVVALCPALVLDLHEAFDGAPGSPPFAAAWAYAEDDASAVLAEGILPTVRDPDSRTFAGALAARGIPVLTLETRMVGPLGARVRALVHAVERLADRVAPGATLIDQKRLHGKLLP